MSAAIETFIHSVSPTSLRGQKRVARILEAATQLFLRDGYDNTSVDAILEKAGGSKATLYSYFPTKAELFNSVVENIVATSELPNVLDPSDDMRTTMQRFAEARLNIIFSHRHQELLRLVIAERQRFPNLASTYYRRGPSRGHAALSDYLQAAQDTNTLDIDDPSEAAEVFVAILLRGWYKEQLFCTSPLPNKRELSERAQNTVEQFLSIYSAKTVN